MLSNHLVCHIALRNFQNFLPSALDTSSLITVMQCIAVKHCASQCTVLRRGQLITRLGRKRVISLSWKLGICQTCSCYPQPNCVKFSPPPSLPHFAPTQSYLKASVSLCLAFGLQILNGNQADCLPICPQPVEEEGQPM